MIEIRAKKNCCGCNACGDICPKGAISFSPDRSRTTSREPKAEMTSCRCQFLKVKRLAAERFLSVIVNEFDV